MITRFSPSLVLIICCFAVPLRAYDNFDDPQRVAIRERAVAVYRAEGLAAGEAALLELLKETRERGRPDAELFTNLWKESQLHSGKEDAAWSTVLYQFILVQSTAGDFSGRTPWFGQGTALFQNLIAGYQRQGKVQEAHAWGQVALRMARQRGLYEDPETYAKTGENLLPFLPDVPRRDFRVYSRVWSPRIQRYVERFSGYEFFYLHKILMEHAWQIGDWGKAAEYADWLRQLGGMVRGQAPMSYDHQDLIHTEYFFTAGTRMLSEIAWLHGYREEALDLLREAVVEFPAPIHRVWHQARMQEMRWNLHIGRGEPGLLDWVDRMEPYFQGNPYTPGERVVEARMTRIWGLFLTGGEAEALQQLTDLLERYPRSVEVLSLAVDMMVRGGLIEPEREAVFGRLLSLLRERGLKILEPGFYENYAAWLLLAGRTAEALVAQREAIRLFEALNLPAREVYARATLLVILQKLGQQEAYERQFQDLQSKRSALRHPLPAWMEAVMPVRPGGFGTLAETEISVDLQPVQMRTRVPEGAVARTRFTLSNPGASRVQGALHLSEPARWIATDEEHLLRLDWTDPDADSRTIHPLTLEPFAQMHLDLFAAAAEGERTLSLEWRSEGLEANPPSSWTFERGERLWGHAVINAAEVLENPFYLVPIHHTLQRPPSGEAQAVDFRVRTSVPSRVEVYRESDEQLLYIDHNGDGVLSGVGDLLVIDVNGNRWPDINFAAGEEITGIVLYVRPTEAPAGTSREDVDIEIQVWTGEDWSVQAVNRMRR